MFILSLSLLVEKKFDIYQNIWTKRNTWFFWHNLLVSVTQWTLRLNIKQLRPYVRRKSDLPLYIGQIHAFYFDTTPYTLNDNVNTKSVWLNNLIDVCFSIVLKRLEWCFKQYFSEK